MYNVYSGQNGMNVMFALKCSQYQQVREKYMVKSKLIPRWTLKTERHELHF